MHTVLSAFDERAAAERAADVLVKEGFPRENIHLEANRSGELADDGVTQRAIASPEREIAVGPRAASALEHFFDRLLGGGEHAAHARTYAEAVRRGSTVVVVDTASEVSAERAATVLQEGGAFDIAERTEQWSRDGWSAAASGEQQLEGGAVVRWRAAHVLHRRSGPPLREIIGGRQAPRRE